MYVYKITNLINNKLYIGITNDYKRRWANEKSYPSDPKRRQVIQNAIHEYGKENFKFEVLYQNLSIEEAIKTEERLIKELNSLVPNGYNVDKGGSYHPHSHPKYGGDNPKAKLTNEEAQYIKDHRDLPLYILYEEFSDKISYEAFKKCYYNETYKNIIPSVEAYPYNREFSNQFTSGNKLEYDEVVELRQRYAKGEYWRNVYQDYKDRYHDDLTFWNIYYGNRYKLVMPEVFTPENRHLHAGYSKSGTMNGRAKLKEEDVLKIRKLWKDGITRKELYDMYPQVSTTTIRDIINNKTWKHLL